LTIEENGGETTAAVIDRESEGNNDSDDDGDGDGDNDSEDDGEDDNDKDGNEGLNFSIFLALQTTRRRRRVLKIMIC